MDKEINYALNKYIELLRKKFDTIEAAYLFGSFATDKSNKYSDIDVALVFSDLEDSKRFDVQVQLMLLASKIDLRIEPHPISHENFYSGNPFGAEIRKTGVKIAG